MRVLICLVFLCGLVACSDGQDGSASQTDRAGSKPEQKSVAGAVAEPPSGKAVFEHWCQPCHGAGPGHAGTMALAARYGEDKAVLLEREDLTVEHVKHVVRNGFNMMPPLKPTEVTDAELEPLAEYIASSPKADE